MAQPQYAEQQCDRGREGGAHPGQGRAGEVVATLCRRGTRQRHQFDITKIVNAAAIRAVHQQFVVAGQKQTGLDRQHVRTPPAHRGAAIGHADRADRLAVDVDNATHRGLGQQQGPGFRGRTIELEAGAQRHTPAFRQFVGSPAQRHRQAGPARIGGGKLTDRSPRPFDLGDLDRRRKRHGRQQRDQERQLQAETTQCVDE